MENELKKCLMCPRPGCAKCPAATDVRRVIGLLRVGKVQEAGAILFENNPLSAITGAVCPNHLFCKGGCVKGVDFGVIEREVSRKYLEAHTPPSSLGHPFTLKGNILIVGSGPAGLSLSYYLAKVGYKVEVWERCEKLGGMLRYGIPDFRLDKGLIDKVFGVIKRYGVVFKTNMQVDLRDLPKGFDMIVLAIGAGVSRRLDVEGGEYVEYALDFLKNSTTPSPTAPPLTFGASLTLSKGNYVVIGAGNVAIDCALTAVELGAKTVNLCYRRDEAAMKAYPEELAHARNKGVVFNYFYVPKKITKEGVLFDRQGEEIFMPADKVVVAIGQGAVCLDESVKIGCTANGLIQVDGFRTNIEGVYALGDAVTGTSTIIQVVAQAKELAKQLS